MTPLNFECVSAIAELEAARQENHLSFNACTIARDEWMNSGFKKHLLPALQDANKKFDASRERLMQAHAKWEAVNPNNHKEP